MRARLISMVVCAAGAPVSADVILSNLAAPQAQAGTFFGLGSGTAYKAAGFLTNAPQYSLTSVRLTMNYNGGGQGVVSIWQGSPQPTTRLATLNAPVQTGAGNFLFTAGTPLPLTAGTNYWVLVESVASPTGSFIWECTAPATLPTGTGTATTFLFNGSPSGMFNLVEINANPPAPTCYANCDGSSVAPVLNANDFQCFIDRYVGGTAYANCDGSSVAPVLNANDFQCFINKYVAGCS